MIFARQSVLEAAWRATPFTFAAEIEGPTWTMAPHLRLVSWFLWLASYGHIDRLGISMPPGCAKEGRVDEPIPTPSGWRLLGDLRPGDEVFGPDGLVTKVIARTAVDPAAPKLRVGFTDGTHIDVHPEHEWTVFDRAGSCWRTLETQWIARQRYWSGSRARFQLPHREALDCPTEDLLVPPYTFGVWLGDGTARAGVVTLDPKDEASIRAAMELEGELISSRYVHPATGVPRLHLRSLQTRLKALGVFGDKHIPERYIFASVVQRRALLAGLVDSDGYVHQTRGRVIFSSSTARLARDVELLVRSLGYSPTLRYIQEQPTGVINGQPCRRNVDRWAVDWTPHDDGGQGSLARKQVPTKGTRRRVGIRSVTLSEPFDGVCIEVDRADGLYLLGSSMTPTHNSTLCSRIYPAWCLDSWPKTEIVLASYEASMAERWGREARDLVAQNQDRLRCRLSDISQAVAWWYTTEGGYMRSAGAGGALTGLRARRFIIDDPIKGFCPLASTPVAGPDGWKRMDELIVGDEIFDHGGRAVKVLEVHPAHRGPVYRVTFSDGAYLDTDAHHLWTVFERSAHDVYRNQPTHSTGSPRRSYDDDWWAWSSTGRSATSTVTTLDLLAALRTGRGQTNWVVPNGRPLRLPEADLPIDPYVLGLWLGNGSKTGALITCNRFDVLDITLATRRAGYHATVGEGTNAPNIRFSLPGSNRRADSVPKRMRELGVWDDKHVPARYLRGSAAQRLALLRGLMDSAGTNAGGQAVFCNANRRLIEAVHELIVSLGAKGTVTLGPPGTGRPYWLVATTPPFCPFATARKVVRWNAESGRSSIRRANRTVRSVERLHDDGEFQCVTVDTPSGLFLAGRSMIPTHNSEAHSSAVKDGIWEWQRSVVRSRLLPRSAEIIVQTRWSEDDLLGRLIASPAGTRWVHVVLPAIAEEDETIDTVIGREVADKLRARGVRLPEWWFRPEGTALWPTRLDPETGESEPWFDEAEMADTRLEVGEWVWNCTPVETPILMGNWTTRPISEVRPGDEVIGFTSGVNMGGKSTGNGSRLVRSTVIRVFSKRDVVCDITLASGRCIRATVDHNWWMPKSGGTGKKGNGPPRPQYRTAVPGRSLAHVWPVNEPEPTEEERYFMLESRSQRFIREKDTVVAVTPGPVEPVYALETTTGNYVAWGYASSNSLYQQHPAPVEGGMFKRSAWAFVDAHPPLGQLDLARSWDLAASEGAGDYTVGVLMARHLRDGRVFIIDVVRERLGPTGVENLLLSTAEDDRRRYGGKLLTRIEQEGGSSGKIVAHSYTAGLLAGFLVKTERSSGDKETRAILYGAQQGAGNVFLVRTSDPVRGLVEPEWAEAFVHEHTHFGGAAHDDQVDASSLGYNELAERALARHKSRGRASTVAGTQILGR